MTNKQYPAHTLWIDGSGCQVYRMGTDGSECGKWINICMPVDLVRKILERPHVEQLMHVIYWAFQFDCNEDDDVR